MGTPCKGMHPQGEGSWQKEISSGRTIGREYLVASNEKAGVRLLALSGKRLPSSEEQSHDTWQKGVETYLPHTLCVPGPWYSESSELIRVPPFPRAHQSSWRVLPCSRSSRPVSAHMLLLPILCRWHMRVTSGSENRT